MNKRDNIYRDMFYTYLLMYKPYYPTIIDRYRDSMKKYKLLDLGVCANCDVYL